MYLQENANPKPLEAPGTPDATSRLVCEENRPCHKPHNEYRHDDTKCTEDITIECSHERRLDIRGAAERH
jgi:hypothetical protein